MSDDIMKYMKPDGIMDPEGKYPNPLTGKPYRQIYYETVENSKWYNLITWKEKHIFMNKLHNNQVILLTSATGSGKTVITPKLLLHYFDYTGKIAVTIPKKGIAKSAAQFAAKCLDATLGYEVGFIHGDDKTQSCEATRLLFMTEGILLSELTGRNQDLSNYSAVIIDEAHERSTNVDLVLLLLRNLVQRRPEFKIVIMSATVNEKVFIDYFSIPGIKFDTYTPADNNTRYKITDKFSTEHVSKKDSMEMLTKKVKEVINKSGGHIIIFVTSKSEISTVCRDIKEDLERAPNKPICLELHSKSGSLYHPSISGVDMRTLVEMKDVDFHEYGFGRKVIVATNAAESSLTVNGTEYVIDNGMAFMSIFDPVINADRMGKNYVAQANIKQRCGRTGRTNDGYCIRIYSNGQWNHFENYPKPNIQYENFTSNLLAIMKLKITGNLKNSLALIQEMIEPPNKDLLKHAINNIYYLNLIKRDGYLTPIGRTVSNISKLTPEVSLMVLASGSFSCTYEVIVIAAMLTTIPGFDDLIIKPDPKNKYRSMNDYFRDMKHFSEMYYDYGDHFMLLAIFREWSELNGKERDTWCRKHGIIGAKLKEASSLVDDLWYRFGNMSFPIMFDEPNPPQYSRVKTEYQDLAKIQPQQYGGGKFQNNLRQRSRTTRKVTKPLSMVGGKAKAAATPKPIKVDKQQVEKQNKMTKADEFFKKYYMPVDGVLPRRPKTEYLEDEILACIYYGFHRNIGYFIDGKKYKSKSSPIGGSMKKSIFDILSEMQAPQICIYNGLVVEEGDYGEQSSYTYVSKMDESIMAGFM